MRREAGKLVEATIVSLHDGLARIRYGERRHETRVKAGEAMIFRP